MSTVLFSPRPGMSVEEKRLRDQQYVKNQKEMTAIFEERAELIQTVCVLALAVGALGKGQVLRFYTGDNEYHDFSRKDLRSAIARTCKTEKELKNYTRVAKKKTKTKVGPESLKGTYTPIYAGKVLTDFFTLKPENFGPLFPSEWKHNNVFGESLMSKLDLVSKGYMLRNTLTMLFFIYVRTMELQEVENAQFSHFDDVMIAAFAKQPAAFYTAEKVPKILMTKAIKEGIITRPLTTEEVIRVKKPTFNNEGTPIIKTVKPEKQVYKKAFPNFFFQLLASNNYYSKQNLKDDENPQMQKVLEALNAENVTQQMIAEHNIVHDTATRWGEYLEPSRKINRDKKKKERDAEKKAEKLANAPQ